MTYEELEQIKRHLAASNTENLIEEYDDGSMYGTEPRWIVRDPNYSWTIECDREEDAVFFAHAAVYIDKLIKEVGRLRIVEEEHLSDMWGVNW